MARIEDESIGTEKPMSCGRPVRVTLARGEFIACCADKCRSAQRRPGTLGLREARAACSADRMDALGGTHQLQQRFLGSFCPDKLSSAWIVGQSELFAFDRRIC
jgi:hypothetical protein